MDKKSHPRTVDINDKCPKSDLVASPKDHFGQFSWEFECDAVEEVAMGTQGVTIQCAITKDSCYVDDGLHYFVNSPEISPLKSFFEVTMKYFDK